jgi:hypothetical protein
MKMELQVEKGGCERCQLAENSTHCSKISGWLKVRDSGQIVAEFERYICKKGPYHKGAVLFSESLYCV